MMRMRNQKPEYRNQRVFLDSCWSLPRPLRRGRNDIALYRCIFVLSLWLLVTGYWLLAATAEDAFVYDSSGKRDPFVPLVGAGAKAAVSSIEEILSIEDVNLQGIASDSQGRMFAIINGEMIREGETIGRLTVKDVSRYRAVLIIDGSEHVMDIYEYEEEENR